MECRAPSGYAEAFLRAGSCRVTAGVRGSRHRTPRLHRLGARAARRRRGPRRDRSRLVPLSWLRPGRPRRVGARARARRPRRHGRGSRGVRCGHPSRGAFQRPDRRPQRRLDLRHQPRRIGRARPARARRPVSGASSSPRRARCTAPRPATTSLDEEAPLRPLTAYAESKVRAEEELFELGGRRLRPRVDAQRDRLRRLASSPARHRAQQSRRLGAHDRLDQPSE